MPFLPAQPPAPSALQPLCPVDAVAEGAAKQFDIDGNALFAVKKAGVYHLYRNRCPHLGVELNWNPDQFLDREGMLIQCATHGALFLMDSGECVAGPCQGKHLESIPCYIDAGHLCVATAHLPSR